MIAAILYVRTRLLLARSTSALARSRWHDRASAATLARATRSTAAARTVADRLTALRSAGSPAPPGDLLYGSRAIATHLGIPKGVARHLIRVGAVPWFPLAGVACARRSTLAAHFAALEKAGGSGERHLAPPHPSQR